MAYALVLRGQLGPVAREVWFVRHTVDELSIDLVTELMDGRSLYLLVVGGAELSLRRLGSPEPSLDLRPFMTVDLGERVTITFDPHGKPVGYEAETDPEDETSLAAAIREDRLDDLSVTMDWNQVDVPESVATVPLPLEVDGRRLHLGRNVMNPTA